MVLVVTMIYCRHRIFSSYRTTSWGRKDQSHSNQHNSNENHGSVIDISWVRSYHFDVKIERERKEKKNHPGFFVWQPCCLAAWWVVKGDFWQAVKSREAWALEHCQQHGFSVGHFTSNFSLNHLLHSSVRNVRLVCELWNNLSFVLAP